jgi:alginate O-acetyltransferase complex protein AlgI
MAFGSPIFLFLFLPCILLLFAVCPVRFRTIFLLCCSFFIYLWAEGRYIWVLLLTIVWSFGMGRLIASPRSPRRKKLWLVLGVSGDLLVLLSFKYAGFFVQNLNALLGTAGISTLPPPAVPLPLGISFFTFLAVSFLIDTSRRNAPGRPGPVTASLYISFFPTILAGPISPYREMEPQLRSSAKRRSSLEEGATRFIVGLAKKVLIADTLAKTAGAVFAIPARDLTFSLSWLGIAAYTLQIYFDFSGYTDMAVGLGRILGFRFMENFNYPYAATSIRDFWTRWHKSLTRWLRDYVFLPLAYKMSRAVKRDRWLGIKAESWSYSVAMSATMLVCGFWHGASWTFVAWGGYHALAILLERFVWGRRLRKAWRPVRHLYALVLIMAGWVLFRSATFDQAVSYLEAMAGLNHGLARIYSAGLFINPEQIVALAAGILASTPLFSALGKRLRSLRERRPGRGFAPVEAAAAAFRLLLLAALFILSGMYLAQETFQPFLYFRF